MRMKAWQIGILAAIVLAAGALTAVAVAQGVSGDGRDDERAGMMGSGNESDQGGQAQDGQNGTEECPGCDEDQDGSRNGSGAGGQGTMGGNGMGRGDGGGLGGAQLSDDQRRQVEDLMDEHRADIQAWSEQYGDNPESDAAQEALQDLRTEHAEDMQKLFDELGIEGMGHGGGPRNGSDGSSAPCPECDEGRGTGVRQGSQSDRGPSTANPGYSY